MKFIHLSIVNLVVLLSLSSKLGWKACLALIILVIVLDMYFIARKKFKDSTEAFIICFFAVLFLINGLILLLSCPF